MAYRTYIEYHMCGDRAHILEWLLLVYCRIETLVVMGLYLLLYPDTLYEKMSSFRCVDTFRVKISAKDKGFPFSRAPAHSFMVNLLLSAIQNAFYVLRSSLVGAFGVKLQHVFACSNQTAKMMNRNKQNLTQM